MADSPAAMLDQPQADAPSEEVVLEARGLSKVYRDFWGRKKVHALKGLDLKVKRGEIFGLLGPNGSGKSTTIKLMLGLLFPTGGQALVFDRRATEVRKNARLGYLPEESYLYKFLNAEETLDFYARLFDMGAQERKARIDELINMIGLQWAKRRQLKEYSKGMTRRIGLAQALINDPELILLDEPTTGLDPIGTREMKDLILRLRDEGKTVSCSAATCCADMCRTCVTESRFCIRVSCGNLAVELTQLLTVQDETQIRAEGLSSQQAEEEIRRSHQPSMAVTLVSICKIPRRRWKSCSCRIVRESDQRIRDVVRRAKESRTKPDGKP